MSVDTHTTCKHSKILLLTKPHFTLASFSPGLSPFFRDNPANTRLTLLQSRANKPYADVRVSTLGLGQDHANVKDSSAPSWQLPQPGAKCCVKGMTLSPSCGANYKTTRSFIPHTVCQKPLPLEHSCLVTPTFVGEEQNRLIFTCKGFLLMYGCYRIQNLSGSHSITTDYFF